MGFNMEVVRGLKLESESAPLCVHGTVRYLRSTRLTSSHPLFLPNYRILQFARMNQLGVYSLWSISEEQSRIPKAFSPFCSSLEPKTLNLASCSALPTPWVETAVLCMYSVHTEYNGQACTSYPLLYMATTPQKSSLSYSIRANPLRAAPDHAQYCI
jgi:hypothetical protein